MNGISFNGFVAIVMVALFIVLIFISQLEDGGSNRYRFVILAVAVLIALVGAGIIVFSYRCAIGS